MLNRILLFLFVLMSINICLYGLGVANASNLEYLGVISADSDTITDGDYFTVTGGQEISSEGYAADSTSYISVAPKSKESYASFSKTLEFIYAITFGYVSIFILLGLPAVLVFLLATIIGIIQIFAVFYMTAYFIGIFRGASI
jgi:hypothetical protein